MKDQFCILGDFEGSFFTHQNGFLGAFEKSPKDQSHALRVYEGKIVKPIFLPEYKPEEYRNYDSFLLANADNISLYPDINDPINAPGIYNFTQVLLINPKFDKFWESNGKTYGRIRGQLLGITKKTRNDQVDKNIKVDNIEKIDKDEKNPPPVLTTPPPIREQHLKENRGCFSFFNFSWPPFMGCLSNIWRNLGWLLLFFLLFFMFRACNAYSKKRDYCFEIDLLRGLVKEKKETLDSLNQALLIKKKNALKYISSIYFYGNTSTIKDISERDLASVIEFIKQNAKYKYEIGGHSNGVNTNKIDVKRANVVKQRLIAAGVDSTMLKVVAYGDSKIKVDKETLSADSKGPFNANMRVEIKLLEK